MVRLTRRALFGMNDPCACVTCNAMTHVIAACTELDVTKGNSARDFLVETVQLDRESISCDRFLQWIDLQSDGCETKCQ